MAKVKGITLVNLIVEGTVVPEGQPVELEKEIFDACEAEGKVQKEKK
ncbi:hypothetical protein [Bacillus phage vB_BceS-M2]|nr:hypothetical protein PBC5_018 [Bacillus phage PBC5]